ncbi:carbohydrate ABC transporter permease [Isoptericola sp. NPDC019693]|uniref:carbohydrate ABC transporter permease n=1 Tax=Isoptericola sp. NPDC019693 TaxID=3364009 RepID=UPI003794B1E3
MSAVVTPSRTRRPAAVTSGAPRASGAPSRGRNVVVLYAVMALMIVYYLLPVWWLAVNATKSNADLYTSSALWFGGQNVLVDNVVATFTEDGGAFARWLLNTVLYTVGGGIGSLVVSALAGYGFAKYDFPGKRLVFAGLLGVMMIPLTALVIPQYLLMSTVGLVNTPWAVIIPSMLNPFAVYLIRVFAQDAVPDELLEAARLDGASELRAFRSVALHILRPALATVLVFSLVGVWNNYFLPLLMLSDSRLYPITVGLADWYARAEATAGASTPLFNLVITGSLIALVPLVVAFLALQRHWVGGLTLGSVR